MAGEFISVVSKSVPTFVRLYCFTVKTVINTKVYSVFNIIKYIVIYLLHPVLFH